MFVQSEAARCYPSVHFCRCATIVAIADEVIGLARTPSNPGKGDVRSPPSVVPRCGCLSCGHQAIVQQTRFLLAIGARWHLPARGRPPAWPKDELAGPSGEAVPRRPGFAAVREPRAKVHPRRDRATTSNLRRDLELSVVFCPPHPLYLLGCRPIPAGRFGVAGTAPGCRRARRGARRSASPAGTGTSPTRAPAPGAAALAVTLPPGVPSV